MADYSKIKHLKDLNNSMFNERMNRAYDYGYADGLERGIDISHPRGYDKGYQRGLDDAWECARKIVSPNAIPHSTLEKIFGYKCYLSSDFIEKYSASEAIAKVKEYEDKQTEDDKQDKKNKTLIKIKSHNFVGKQYVLYEDVLDLIKQIKESRNDRSIITCHCHDIYNNTDNHEHIGNQEN